MPVKRVVTFGLATIVAAIVIVPSANRWPGKNGWKNVEQNYFLSSIFIYGLFANRDKAKRLARCRRALDKPAKPKVILSNWQERFYQLTGIDPTRCPCCEDGQMQMISILPPSRAPPVKPLITEKSIR